MERHRQRHTETCKLRATHTLRDTHSERHKHPSPAPTIASSTVELTGLPMEAQLVINNEALGNNKVAIGKPLGNNRVARKGSDKVTIGKPLGNRELDKLEGKISLGNRLGNSKETIREPLGNNPDINCLTGNELKILNYLFENCYNRGQRKTTQVTLAGVTESLKISSKNVSKTTLMRLSKKHFIIRKGGKRGNGGFAIYEIPEDIYRYLILNKVTIREPLGNDKVSHKVTDRVTGPPSSSNSILNTITTGNDDWMQEIQTPENLKSLGIGGNHIKQLKDKFSIPVEKIQEGLEAFAYDIGKGELERLKARGIHNVISYFFGAMKNGGYNPVNEGFRPSEQQGLDDALARAEIRIKEIQKKKHRLENLHFEIWQSETTKEEIEKLVPVGSFKYMSTLHQPLVKKYFLENEFSEIQKELQQ